MLFRYVTVFFLILYNCSEYVSCKGNSSLVYVIDYTGSMGDDIYQVRIGSEKIMDKVLKDKSSEIANIVLVTFREQSLEVKNITDPNVFKTELSSIKVAYKEYNPECEEPSMSAIIKGLENSLPNSYMFVFTDAAAKDKHKKGEVIDLCIKKQTQILMIVTFSWCLDHTASSELQVFYDIAEKCNGQVVFINKDDLNKFVNGFTLTEPKSVLLRKTIPKTQLSTPVRFNLDDRVDYATIFATGTNVGLEVGRNDFKDKVLVTRKVWENNVKILKLNNTEPGTYEAKISGASDVTITVYAKSDFTFRHGFAERQPKSLDGTSTRPIADEKQHLAILVTDPDHEVKIEQVNILSTKQQILMTKPLTHLGGDLYVTDKFESPNSTFIIQVKGTSKESVMAVLRNSRTVIEPIPAEKPEIIGNLKKIRVLEKNEVKISCRVSKGLPRPKITWKFQKNGKTGMTLLTESSEDLIIKKVSLDNAGTYICRARNRVGSVQANIELEVTKIPVVSIQEKPKTLVEYGSSLEVTCKVIAHPMPRIVWKDQHGTVIHKKRVAKVSTNMYEFTSLLKVNNIRNPSKYTCFAENDVGSNSDTVHVSPKPAFVINSKLEETTKVNYGNRVKLLCDIKSVLPIERTWFSDRDKELSLKFYTMDNKSEEFTIPFMDIDLQGRYGCKVWLKSDPRVFIEQQTTLVIDDLSLPSITATQDVSDKIFTASCLTKGTPKPKVSWYYATDRNGDYSNLKRTGEVLKIPNIKLNHTGFYKCIAENAVGKSDEIIKLVVEEPPQIITDKIKYLALDGDSVLRIPCIVTGYPDPMIDWKDQDNKIIRTDSKYNVTKNFNHLYLNIMNPTLKDTGSFICEAKNYLGNESKTFETVITDNLHDDRNLYGDFHTIYIIENDSKDIKCNLPHLDSKSVRWYKNGLLTNIVGTYYPIKKASVSDDGNYTCRVNTEDGSMSETYAVDVGTLPTFITDYDSSTMYWFGDDNDFVDCSIKSSKTLDQHHTKVEWSYNGNKTKVDGYKHPIQGWGQYSCKVTNVFGATERSIVVTTDGCLIKRKVDFDDNPPLILNFNVNFESEPGIDIFNEYMLMQIGQTMLISCHNARDKNNFIISDEEYSRAECLKEDKFVINNKVYKYSDIKCEKPVEATTENTKKACTVHGHTVHELIKVGFDIGLGEFIETYKVCFDNKLNVPIFAYTEMAHNKFGKAVDYNKWVNIPNYQGVISTDCNNESKCCYGKGQLVDAIDVDFGPPQASTFNDYNAVGVWKPCENESRISWDSTKEKVRNLLDPHLHSPIFSGASNYEHQNIGIVPRYLWKLINDFNIVIVYVNHPNPTKEDIKCSFPIESDSLLKHHNMIDPEDPYTYLCDTYDFSKQFNI